MFRHLLFSAIVFGLAMRVCSQQTIFNVPTTDVLESGKVYLELDASFKPNGPGAVNRFSSFVPRVVVGAGKNIEVGLNVTGNIQPGNDSTTLSPTIKWRFYENKHSNIALIAGTNLFVPVRLRSYRFGSYSYLAVSKTINKTSLTAGGYVASRNVFAPGAIRSGGQFGFEQAINNKFSAAADWITGGHSAGYFTPGLIYKPHPRLTAYMSYSIGNRGATDGNHFFLFELGYNFN